MKSQGAKYPLSESRSIAHPEFGICDDTGMEWEYMTCLDTIWHDP